MLSDPSKRSLSFGDRPHSCETLEQGLSGFEGSGVRAETQGQLRDKSLPDGQSEGKSRSREIWVGSLGKRMTLYLLWRGRHTHQLQHALLARLQGPFGLGI